MSDDEFYREAAREVDAMLPGTPRIEPPPPPATGKQRELAALADHGIHYVEISDEFILRGGRRIPRDRVLLRGWPWLFEENSK